MAREVTRKVISVGNSEAVTLPSWVQERLGIEQGDQLMFYKALTEDGDPAIGLMKMPKQPNEIPTLYTDDDEGNGDQDG